MDSFYLTVLSVATIILILALTYVGVLLYSTKSVSSFPPMKNPCPDYWRYDNVKGCEFPKTTASKNRGSMGVVAGKEAIITGDSEPKFKGLSILKYDDDIATSEATATYNGAIHKRTFFDMNNSGWDNIYGKKGKLCNQKHWAIANKISWDGVSNTNEC
jgi:hypothetical protein